jgi:hypothetical protein
MCVPEGLLFDRSCAWRDHTAKAGTGIWRRSVRRIATSREATTSREARSEPEIRQMSPGAAHSRQAARSQSAFSLSENVSCLIFRPIEAGLIFQGKTFVAAAMPDAGNPTWHRKTHRTPVRRNDARNPDPELAGQV